MKKIIDPKKTVCSVLITLAVFLASTGICFLLDLFRVKDLNFLLIYVLGILLVAVLTNGIAYSSSLSLLCMLGYNFFFTVPRYSLKINDIGYLVTFALMVAVGVGVGLITYQLKNRLHEISRLNLEKLQIKAEADKEQMKSTMLRSMSHDLRTPLTAIQNGAELLLERNDLSVQEKKEILLTITEKSGWTIRLVENLLSLTRIDNEGFTVKKHAEAVEEIIPQAARSVNITGRNVHYDLPKELMLVPMDATLILQVLVNILNNAIRFTLSGGNIWIQVFSSGKNAVFRVSNDGRPIAEADLPHVFDLYYTAGDTRTHGGMGLGLAICKTVVAAHGGTISARNTDGNRVTFEFTLPLEEVKNG